MLDAVAQGLRHGEHHVVAKRAADGIAAEWQGQAGLLAPPYGQIQDLVQGAVRVGELSLVNDEAGGEIAGENLGDDAIEGDDRGLDLGSEELQGEIGGGEVS